MLRFIDMHLLLTQSLNFALLLIFYSFFDDLSPLMDSFVQKNTKEKKYTGIPNIDTMVTNIEPGTLILIKEDLYTHIHNTFLNIFLTEGVQMREKGILAISKDNPKIDIYKLYETTLNSKTGQGINDTSHTGISNTNNDSTDNQSCGIMNTQPANKKDKMFIAWRYKDLLKERNSFKYNLLAKEAYNNDKLIDDELTLDDIVKKVSVCKNHRIAIYSLLSPIYNIYETDMLDRSEEDRNFQISVIDDFLFQLRKAVKTSGSILMASIPTFLYKDINFSLYFDTVLSLKSNIFTGYLPNYKAVMGYEKISNGFKNRVNESDSLKFGVRFKDKKIVVENINLPPDEPGLPDDVDSSRGCSSKSF